ncbi:NfeD family protein [Kordiimonas sp.]|uniref:NfeD family protein n=1 Tax=Kordiimonas sp. TaxID=1970157 RepID=UPI003A93006C
MEELFIWGAENAHWLWWALGLLLLAGEMVIPGVYLLWIGVAGLATGLVAFFMPGMGFDGHGLVFAVFGAASIYIGNRYFYTRFKEAGEPTVNTRGGYHVGRVYSVCTAIVNGRGHVTVGDSRWLAEGPDMPEGAKVRVIAVQGTVLMVEPLRD